MTAARTQANQAMSYAAEFAAEVESWRARGLGRSLISPASGDAGAQEATLDFTSNDYLGLGSDSRIVAGAIRALEAHGASGRASRLLGGGSPNILAVEQKFADWLGAESALLTPSGYQANMTLLPAVAGRGDVIVSDELNHASLIDAMRLSGATVHIFSHGDAGEAAHILSQALHARRRFVVTEAVFSMDGDVSPLVELDRICAHYSAGLIVDEAHAAGVLGPQGRGGCAAAGVVPLARIVTGGKAMGAAGGMIAGPKALTELLIHRGRGFVFSTAVSPATVGALDASIDIVAGADRARAQLRDHARSVALALGVAAPEAAIVPVPIGPSTGAVEAQAALLEQGMDVRAVRPPTVPEGTARLRVVCRATHTDEDVKKLGAALSKMALGDPPAQAERADAPCPPPRSLVIVGTDTDIGKTVVSAAASLALDARYWKPVQTGDDSDTDEVARLAGTCDSGGTEVPRAIAPPRYWFSLPASPHTAAAEEGAEVDVDELETALKTRRAEAAPRRLVVELAGGLLVPLNGEATQADWIARKRPRAEALDVLLVARSALGTLNHTLLTLESLRARGMKPKALVLVGEPHEANARTLRPLVPALFELPVLPGPSRASLVEWLGENDLATALHD